MRHKIFNDNHLNAACLVFVFIAVVAMKYFWQKNVMGPFIFADEGDYFNIARTMALKGIWIKSIYNPLYPLLLSPALKYCSPIDAYEISKIVNILIFTSSLFFLYPLALRLFNIRPVALMVSSLAVLLPLGSSTFLIWANPLSYFLYFASAFSIIKLTELPHSILLAMIAGAAASLSFLSKQGGIIEICALIMIIVLLLTTGRIKMRNAFVALIPPFITIILIFAFRATQGGDLTGYPLSIHTNFNYFKILCCITKSFIINIGVAYVSGFFVLMTTYILLFRHFFQIEWNQRILIIYAGVTLLGYLALIVAHRTILSIDISSSYEYPMGRYIAGPMVIVFMLGLSGYIGKLMPYFHHGNVPYWILSVGGVIIVLSCGLLHHLGAYDLINSPDMAMFSYIYNQSRILWTNVVEIGWNFRFAEILLLILILLTVGGMSSRAGRLLMIAIIAFMSLAAFYSSYYYTNLISKVHYDFHRIVRYAIRNDLTPIVFDPKAFDSKRISSQPFFIHYFWFGTYPSYGYPYDNSNIIFGGDESENK